MSNIEYLRISNIFEYRISSNTEYQILIRKIRNFFFFFFFNKVLRVVVIYFQNRSIAIESNRTTWRSFETDQ